MKKLEWDRGLGRPCPGCGHLWYSGWYEDGRCSHMNSEGYARIPGPTYYDNCWYPHSNCRKSVSGGARWELAVNVFLEGWQQFGEMLLCPYHQKYVDVDDDGVIEVLDELSYTRQQMWHYKYLSERLERQLESQRRIVEIYKKGFAAHGN